MNLSELVERYVRLWNEPDAERRRQTVSELWAIDGRQVLQPPEAMRKEADELGFPGATLEVRGHDDLTYRAERAYAQFIEPGEFVFRLRDAPLRLQDAATFTWDMVVTASGETVGGGREFLVLDGDGRIVVDYQFID